MTTRTALPVERQQKRSVTKADDGQIIHFLIPWFQQVDVLPLRLPIESTQLFGYFRDRDQILLSTPKHEAQWATAVSTAIAKMASMSWQIDSKMKSRREAGHNLLMNAHAGMGIYGWIPFLSAGLRSYLTLGFQVIEIERATAARGGKIVALHHLNSLRCRLTGDSRFPIHYMDTLGVVHKLAWHQCMILVDGMGSAMGDTAVVESAAERAYLQIIKLAAIERYVYEKVSGQRPQSLYFVGGVTHSTIVDAMQAAKNDAQSRNLSVYMGAAVVPVMGDVPVTVGEIPLAELPDGFDANRERERADLIYANAIGLDVQSLNPQLVGRQGLGSTGNQAQVLENKERQSGIAAYRQQFMHQMNQMVMDASTTFAFMEQDNRDRLAEADLKQTNANTRKIQIDSGEITADQARNLAVDAGELPDEFLEVDETAGGVLTDTEKSMKGRGGWPYSVIKSWGEPIFDEDDVWGDLVY